LLEQRRLLGHYGDAFDAGNDDFARPTAVSIRVLVHDTRRATSVLEHLRLKSRIRFMDTAQPIIPANLLSNPGLAIGLVARSVDYACWRRHRLDGEGVSIGGSLCLA
jgi:hypothetical protein